MRPKKAALTGPRKPRQISISAVFVELRWKKVAYSATNLHLDFEASAEMEVIRAPSWSAAAYGNSSVSLELLRALPMRSVAGAISRICARSVPAFTW